jgi:hypothetical protein
VTVRGKTDGSLPSLGDCEFVKVGASTAIPTTVAALDAEFKKNRDAAEKKYDEKSVVVKVKVLDAKTEDKKVIWTVTDAAGKGTAKIKAWADPLLDDKFLKELEMVKAGDVIVLIAEAVGFTIFVVALRPSTPLSTLCEATASTFSTSINSMVSDDLIKSKFSETIEISSSSSPNWFGTIVLVDIWFATDLKPLTAA